MLDADHGTVIATVESAVGPVFALARFQLHGTRRGKFGRILFRFLVHLLDRRSLCGLRSAVETRELQRINRSVIGHRLRYHRGGLEKQIG